MTISIGQLVRGSVLAKAEFDRGVYAGPGKAACVWFVPGFRKREVLFRPGPCTLCGHHDAPYSALLHGFNDTEEIGWLCHNCFQDSYCG